jgi:hypothetical protein
VTPSALALALALLAVLAALALAAWLLGPLAALALAVLLGWAAARPVRYLLRWRRR